MKQLRSKEVCPTHDRCSVCREVLGRLPGVAMQTIFGVRLYHVHCAPPALRKAYHERDLSQDVR
jgi:hypothetical protein